MTAPMRRGACPALAAPMQTGDGLLARLSPVSGGVSPKALIGLCESAARHGNGTIEVTARGSLQVRGLSPASAPAFAADIDALGIAVRTGLPVEIGPLAGLDATEIADPTPPAEAIRRTVRDAGLAARLAPKVSVVVDGGGALSMDALAADVRLTAERHGDRVLWRLSIAGDAAQARPLALLEPEAAPAAALDVLERIAALGRDARARDLDDAAPAGEASAGMAPAGATPAGAAPAGRLIPLSGSRFALPVALPFGSIEAATLAAFAARAAASGVSDIRSAPGRALLPVCASRPAAEALRRAAAELGFVTDPADPRRRIDACPGTPACASARIPARVIAERLAALYAQPAYAARTLHVSGCAKGCARQAPASVTLVGDENGVALVADGTVRQKPVAYSSIEDLPAAVARLLGSAAGQNTPAQARPGREGR
jgi:precorrin-3B synthase